MSQVTRKHMPWEKGQVVVGLSRTRTSKNIIIVSDMKSKEVAEKLWKVICKVTQWTAMMESIINQLSISPHSKEKQWEKPVLNIAQDYPWKMRSYTLPLSYVGYVYLLVSIKRRDKFYVGMTKRNIAERLREHNSGVGSKETKNADDMPWACIAFISSSNNKNCMESLRHLEHKWQHFNSETKRRMMCGAFECIENGEKIVQDYNSEQESEEDKLTLKVLIRKT